MPLRNSKAWLRRHGIGGEGALYQFFVDDAQIHRKDAQIHQDETGMAIDGTGHGGLGEIVITGDDVRHIRNVLRMRPGEEIRISNGKGADYFCEIATISEESVTARILERPAEGTELPSRIFLFQAIPKGERMEYVIQKAVELGVHEIIPVEMRYCVVKLTPEKKKKRVERWQAIARSAAKQAKRSRIPVVHPVMGYEEAIAYAKTCDLCLVPYESEHGMQGTREALRRIAPGMDISVIIGPEGGFSEEEIALAKEEMHILSLGRRILRTDTAAITVMSMLMLAIEMRREGVDAPEMQ